MKTNSFDAASVMQPGGLYGSVNDGILQSLLAYFQFKDKQAERERAGRREDMQMGRAQLSDALAQAERYGVTPDATATGWIDPKKMPLVQAAVGRFQESEVDRKMARDRQLATDIANGIAEPVVDREVFMRDLDAKIRSQGGTPGPDTYWLDPEYQRLSQQWAAKEKRDAAVKAAAARGMADASRNRLNLLSEQVNKIDGTERMPVWQQGSEKPRMNAQGQMVNDLGQVVTDPSQAAWDGAPMINPNTGEPMTRQVPLTRERLMQSLAPLLPAGGLTAEDEAVLRQIIAARAGGGRGGAPGGAPGGAQGPAAGQPAQPGQATPATGKVFSRVDVLNAAKQRGLSEADIISQLKLAGNSIDYAP